MSATKFEPYLPANTVKMVISVLTEADSNVGLKLCAVIEDSTRLVTHTIKGDNALHDAKQWIKQNL